MLKGGNLQDSRAKEPTIKENPHHDHLTDEEIARFIDGAQGPPDRTKVLGHLRSCKRCFEIYQDTAICRGLWSFGRSTFESINERADIEKELVSHGLMSEGTMEGEARSVSRPSYKGRLRYRLIAVCVAVLLAVVLWISNVDRMRDPRLDPAMLTPVRAAIETASKWGRIVIPGGEESLNGRVTVYRSGSVPLNDSLMISLNYLYETYQQGGPSREVTYWLMAGYVATGQVDAARDLLVSDEERTEYLSDSSIAILEALIAYMDGKYNKSEALFRKILEVEPDNPVAGINLAIVLDEQGDDEEAREILLRIQDHHAGSPLAARAQSILSDLQNQ